MIYPVLLFKSLMDETRLRCLLLMINNGELCVCEFCYALEASQPKISRHLATLRKAGIVQDRREGRWVYYQIHPALPEWARTVIQVTSDGARETDLFQNDHQRLAAISDRPCPISSSSSSSSKIKTGEKP